MTDVYDKQSFMIGLEKEIEIVVETDEVSLEEPEESEFILEDWQGVVEITESRTESVMASCEDMVVVGGSKQRKQLKCAKIAIENIVIFHCIKTVKISVVSLQISGVFLYQL